MIRDAISFKGEIRALATVKAMEEGYDKKGRVVTEGDIYYNDLVGFALHNCSYYMCSKCTTPYFGGMQDCGQAMQAENSMKKEDLMCEPCATEELGFGNEMCEKHGNEYCDWKCMYCCSIALFYCTGGGGKFCTPCHNDAMSSGGRQKVKTDCTGGANCPLGLKSHPKADGDRNKSSYPLGCSLCRSEKLALIAQNENAGAGVNLEMREDMRKRFDHVKGHDLGREMRIVAGPQPKAAKNPGVHAAQQRQKACCTIF